MRTTRLVAIALAALLALSACNVTVSPSLTPTPGTSTPTAGGVPVTGATTTPTASAAGAPQLTVTAATNCRTGPSAAYELVFTANPGPSYPILGVYNQGGYWIIANPLGGTCWIWGQNAVVSGNAAGLPAYPAPSLRGTAGPGEPKPSEPGDLSASKACTAGVVGTTRVWVESVTLTWNASDEEIGYQIYRDGVLVASVPAGATSYFIQFRYDQAAGAPQFDAFGVQAFNDSKNSVRAMVNMQRCP